MQTEQTGIRELAKESIATTTEPGTDSGKTLAFQVQQNDVPRMWPMLRPFIERWVPQSQGAFDSTDLLRLGIEGKVQFFVFYTVAEIKLVCITEIVQYPRMKAVRLMGMSGKNPRIILQFLPAFEQWAKENGAVRLETFATRKVERLMGRLGLNVNYSFMSKSLIG